MRHAPTCMLVLAALSLGGMPAQARVAYADSDIFSIDTITSIDAPSISLPTATVLSAIYPNPFNPSTTIVFDLAKDGPAELAIFDVRGRLVDLLESGPMNAGRRQTTWDGQGHDGRAVPSGTYFCRLVAGRETRTMKLMLAK